MRCWVWFLCPILAACERPGPCFGIDLGQRYQVRLLEIYDESSTFVYDPGGYVWPSCGADFDLQPSAEVTVRVTDQLRRDLCDVNVVELESPVRDELGPPTPAYAYSLTHGPTSGIFQVYREATIAGCVGTWGVVVRSNTGSDGADGNPFLEPQPGETPPIFG